MKGRMMKSAPVGLFLLATILLLSPAAVLACGYGNAGGADYYTPQRQTPFASNQVATAISPEQAKKLVSKQITKLNPDLKVGKVNDAGSYYEVEVVNGKNEIVQVLGVDKNRALVSLLN